MRLCRKSVVSLVSLMFVLSLFAGYQSAFANGTGPLVETQWVEDNLKNVKVVFVDNWPSDKDEYMKKHIDGSQMMSVGALMGTIGNGSAAPDKAQFETMMQGLGISSNDHVVLYGAKGESVFTLGAFWLMEYFGHKNLSYMNGGLAKWNKEGRPATDGAKAAAPGNYKVKSTNESIRISVEDVLKNLDNKKAVLLDARSADEYTGKDNSTGNKRIGHIPHAINLDSYQTNFNAKDGTVKSAADLKGVYESKGITKDKEVIAYCQGGIKASNAYFILKHVLGYPNVKNYVGSWGEWGNQLDFNKYPIDGQIVPEKK